MSLKDNVNKIHSDLSSKYQVHIKELQDKNIGNYVQLLVKEGNVELIANIKKQNLEFSVFEWSYLSNPSDENSLVERKSNIDSFIDDVDDIFRKNRFDSDYLKNLR